jgi:hypothetical protein
VRRDPEEVSESEKLGLNRCRQPAKIKNEIFYVKKGTDLVVRTKGTKMKDSVFYWGVSNPLYHLVQRFLTGH